MNPKPNIVFILTDDQGYGDLGCHGNTVLQTPNMDRLHTEGIRFTNYHVGPTCAPTRSGLFTGHYANSTGVWHTVGGRSLLRRNEVTLATALQENGYRTGLFGKWHLGDNYPYRPQDRGFESVVMHGGGGISQVPDYWGNDYFDDTYFVNGTPKKFEGYCTDVFFREATGFIKSHREEPFFCCITTNAPHSPYNVPKQYHDLYVDTVPKDGKEDDRSRFYGMITNIDENMGKLYTLLDTEGLLENTIVIFMTDNGTSCGGPGYNTCGLKGQKASEYDGGHRVPFFLRLPGGPAGKDVNTLTANVDFMPTLLDLCGVDLEKYSHCDFHGKSLTPLIREDEPDWEDRTLVTDSQRLVNPVKWRKSAVMTERWRLINGSELYDINEDRGQENDLHDRHPDVVEQLRQAYDEWWDTVSTQFEEEVPISIGSDAEKRVRLTGHDWRHLDNPWQTDPNPDEGIDHLAYSQSHVRKGTGGIGYHELYAEAEGTYRFELRRWPEEEGKTLLEGIDDAEASFNAEEIQPKCYGLYMGGVAMPLKSAFLKLESVNGRCGPQDVQAGDEVVNARKDVSAGQTGISFTANLSKGHYHLTSGFEGEEDLIRGAYFVYVTRLED